MARLGQLVIAGEVALPAGLVGRPGNATAHLWHLQAMETARGLRRQYHARWLSHLAAPEEPGRLPLVSVVIPVHNRAAMVIDAIESCLRQSYPSVEVVVVDDGSTDRLDDTLRPRLGAIRLLKRPHGGVAAARNAGIAAARGEYIHFLDSDNVFYEQCVELKVGAFRAIPDAELCYSAFDEVDARNRPRACGISPPTGDQACPTNDLLNATCPGYPFIVSSVMLPTWLCRELGGFEEDLVTDEDRRYWFRLGLRGTKVIGYDFPLLLRRRTADSLTANRKKSDWSTQIVALRNVLDLVGEPAHWWCVPQAFRAILNRKTMLGYDPTATSLRAELESGFARLGDGRSRNGLSPLPMALECRLALDEMAWLFGRRPGRAVDDFPRRLARTLDRCLQTGHGLTPGDTIYWQASAERVGHGPLPGLLRELAGRPDIEPALSVLTETTRQWSQEGKLSRWYAARSRAAGIFPDTKPGLRNACAPISGAWCQQWRRWRVLHARLTRRIARAVSARRKPEGSKAVHPAP
jgi:glycosyltransferase involved in cell wall biosynthesis